MSDRPSKVSSVKSAAELGTQRTIANRLRRTSGQLAAVITAIETGASCRDVVTQLAAVSSALDRAGFVLVSSAMKDCVDNPAKTAEAQDGLTIDELQKLFLMLA